MWIRHPTNQYTPESYLSGVILRLYRQGFVFQLKEDLHHVDELHHQLAVCQNAAVNVAAVLDLQIFAGGEGKRRYIAHRYGKVHILAVDMPCQMEAGTAQSDGTASHIHKSVLRGANHAEGAGAVQICFRVRAQLVLHAAVDQPAPIGNKADLVANGRDFM